MTIVNKLKQLFREIHGKEVKPDTITWKDIGPKIGTTGQAAKAIWRRYRNEQRAKQVTMKQNIKSVKKHPHQGLHLVISDCHVPFHNHKLINGLYELLSDIGRDVVGLHIIGDFLDLNSLSRHDVYKRTAVPGITLDIEYQAGNEVLDNFDSLLPDNCIKTFIYGNHCDRHNRWMADVQNAKTPLLSPKEALKLKERGFKVFTNWSQDFFKLGAHLELIHGTYTNTYCCKKHMDTLRGSVMFGHSHRIQSYIEGNQGSWNIGGLYDITSPAFNYADRTAKSQWQNGFALVYIDSNGDYYVNQIIANDGKFVYGNKVY